MNVLYCFPQQVPMLTLLMRGRWAALWALLKYESKMTEDEVMGTLHSIVRGI